MAKEEKKEAKKDQASYGAKDIYVLEGLDPVRKRPAMYIGSTGSDGQHHLIWECVDNAIDEAMAGYCKNIEISLLPQNRVKVVDDGRGIPVDKHPQTKKSALETVMTTLHAGAKFGSKAYQVSGGLHGVGVSVVCALSTFMRVEVCRDGGKFYQEYVKGKPKTKVTKFDKCKKTGTTVIFEPDSEIFKERKVKEVVQKEGEQAVVETSAKPADFVPIKFDAKKILNHLRQQAYLTQGVRMTFSDLRGKEPYSYTFYFEDGIRAYIKYLTRGDTPRHENVFYTKGEKEGIVVEAAFQYTNERECYEESFANNIFTGEGGTHLTGFRGALTRTLNDYARKNNFLKGTEENLTGEDVREGLTAVVSVKIREPQFEGQTKARLGNTEARVAVDTVVAEAMTDFLERSPQDARAMIESSILAQKARNAAKSARETVLRKGVLEGLALPGKLADCTSRKPEESEIYIVEGESAGGCFSGDTKVALTDGRSLSFKKLIKENKEGKKNYCYTMEEQGKIGISLIRDPRKTRKNAEVIKIILDNKEEIICTPDHQFMLRNGFYKRAKDLTLHDSLAPLYRKYSSIKTRQKINGYEMVYEQKIHKWVYTHLLSIKRDQDAITNNSIGKIFCVHHKDFNKLNNNPDNLVLMDRQEHLALHSNVVRETMARPEIQEKIRKVHQSKEYRAKIKATMLKPEMRKMLSERAKRQWKDEAYKQYMTQKFFEFYRQNKEYREKNNKLLFENQKKYWNDLANREKWSKKVKEYFEIHPEKKKELSLKAKNQWQDKKLIEWRKERTKEQWTDEFRLKRKLAYNLTYQEKALKLLRKIFDKEGEINKGKYQQERIRLNDKSILRFDTICQRFFEDNETKLKEAVLNYNHKIKEIVELNKKMDVYDFEVEGTHNFALASGVFVHNSSRQARDRHFQAILPLRGKILNVEKARLDKMLSSKEIRSLIIAMGTAVAEDFDIEKLRYHRIIIMCDADSDGNHIKTLLLTLFYRHFQPMIERGYIYAAQPPLYKIQHGKRIEYAYNDEDKEEIVADIRKEQKAKKGKTEKAKEGEEAEEKITGVNIQRYKGLGEMNPQELWDTTMNPENRVLLQITMESAREADKVFDVLMGEEVLPRKRFIQAHAKKVKNLDI